MPTHSVYWEIKRGDLVKIKYHHFLLNGTEKQTLYGVVVGEPVSNQISLFPEVDVYVFKTKKIESLTAGSVEIVSNS
jgi:hypothetical protein